MSEEKPKERGRPHFSGQALRRCREEIGISQTELGELSGVSAVTINMAEQGRSRPYGHIIGKLTRALGVPFEAVLVDDDGQPVEEVPPVRTNRPEVLRDEVAAALGDILRRGLQASRKSKADTA